VGVWAATLIMVVATDLLTGVLVGIGLSLLELLPHARRLKLGVDDEQRGDTHELALHGTATFLTLPKLSAKLEAVPAERPVILNVERLLHIDHTCAEMVREWMDRRRGAGTSVELSGAAGRLRNLAA
jgi:MFS superfamily sulfate permease-like transporter